eukprot:17034-Pelagococcus_subviridis.AAC.2
MRFTPTSTSDVVVCLPTLSRNVPTAYASGISIARSTDDIDAAAAPVWHAAPALAATEDDNVCNKTLALTPLTPTESVFGSRSASFAGPFTRTPAPSSPPSSATSALCIASLSVAMYDGSASSSFVTSAHAAPRPTTCITFSVPARLPDSCPPP